MPLTLEQQVPTAQQQQASQQPVEQDASAQQQEQNLTLEELMTQQSDPTTAQVPSETANAEAIPGEAVLAPPAAVNQPRPRYNPVRFDFRMPAMRLPSPLG